MQGRQIPQVLLNIDLAIPFYSQVTFQHLKTSHFLHSHAHKYPLKHDDGKISSQGQQVNAYGHSDQNSYWEIVPVDPEHFKEDYKPTAEEVSKNIRYLKNLDVFRLRHVGTDKFLVTHDVASPLTTTNMEITAVDFEAAENRYADSVWRVRLGNSKDDKRKLNSKKDDVLIINTKFDVALHSHKKKLLPAWGFNMQEVNGNKKIEESTNYWTVNDVKHANIVDGIQFLTRARDWTSSS